MANSSLDKIREGYKARLGEIKKAKDKARSFLKKLQDGFNGHLDSDQDIKMAVSNPVYKQGEEFPIYFDLVLNVSQGEKPEDFILRCTASEVADNEFRVNDGVSQHTFYTDDSHQEENSAAFAKLADNFIDKFNEIEDIQIELDK